MTRRQNTRWQQETCGECGIRLTDGYCLWCKRCTSRRDGRIRRGELVTPNGYPGEAIDNKTGRIIAYVG